MKTNPNGRACRTIRSPLSRRRFLTALAIAVWPAFACDVSDEGPRAYVADAHAEPDAATRRELFGHVRRLNAANRASRDRVIAEFRDRMRVFREGVPAFADDATGFLTQFGVLARMTADGWDWLWGTGEGRRAARFIQGKFDDYVFTEDELRGAIEEAVTQYRYELEANRTEAVMAASRTLRPTSVGVRGALAVAGRDVLLRDVAARAMRLADDAGDESVRALVYGEVSGTIAGAVIARLLRRMIVQIAAKVGVTGGALVVGTAGGAAGGSALGPGGSAVGSIGGFIVGLLVDLWFAERAEAKIVERCDELLRHIERQVCDGIDGDAWRGLRGEFDAANAVTCQAFKEALLGSSKGDAR